MTSLIQHVNQRLDIYQTSEFQKQVYLNADKKYLNQHLMGRNSKLYTIGGSHNKKVTELRPDYDPKYILRMANLDDGKQHVKLFIPCGRPGQMLRQGIPSQYTEKNANQTMRSG